MIEMCAFQVGNLTYLSIEGNMIGDQGFQKLAKVIPGTEVCALLKQRCAEGGIDLPLVLCQIQHLNLSHNGITPNSDPALSRLMEKSDELRVNSQLFSFSCDMCHSAQVLLMVRNGFSGMVHHCYCCQ